MIKLKDKIKTIYVADQFTDDVRNIMNSVDEIDICDVRLTKGPANEIMRAIREGVHVYDSKNKDRDNILQIDWRAAHEREEGISIPRLQSLDDIAGYMSQFKKGELYVIDTETSDIELKVLILTILYRPSIRFDISRVTNKLFGIVSSKLYSKNLRKVIDRYDNYLLQPDISNNGNSINVNGIVQVSIEEKQLDKPFKLYGLGEVTWNDLLSSRSNILPSVFGSVNLRDDELWAPVIEGIFSEITDEIEKRDYTLYNILRGEL